LNYWVSGRLYFAATIPILIALASIQGCVTTSSTSLDCENISDAEASVKCLNGVMFGDVFEGFAIGAVGGAVLGGAVSFAASGGHAPGALARGIMVGGMVGGVAGGLAAYLNNLQSRSAGDTIRAAAANAANIAAFNRQLAILNKTMNKLIQIGVTTENKPLLQVTDNRIIETTNVYLEAAKKFPPTPDSDHEVANMNEAAAEAYARRNMY
jgi:hypothetical protein